MAIEDKVKVQKHTHNGLDCDKIHSSNIEYSPSGDTYIKSTRLESAVKDLDKTLVDKLDKISGKEGNLISILSDGSIKDSSFSPLAFAKSTHSHDNKINTINAQSGKLIVSSGDGQIESVNINYEDIITEKRTVNFMKKTLGKDGNIVIFDKDGGVKDSEISVKAVADNKHIHDDYIKKIKSKDGNVAVLTESGIKDTDFPVKDIATVQMLSKKSDIIKGSIGNFAIFGDDFEIEDARFGPSEFAPVEHIHENYLTVEKFEKLIENSPNLKKVIEDIFKKYLKESFKL